MDAHFTDALSDRSRIAGVAEGQPVDPLQDFCASPDVP
jgi:hypothetical protein